MITTIETNFDIHPANKIYNQKISVKPIAHHYEEKGELPYIKYNCPLCEKIAKKINTPTPLCIDGLSFLRFSIPKNTPNCPCCGINLDWTGTTRTYKEFINTIDFSKIQKNNGIYEYHIKTIDREKLSLGISYETNDDAKDVYIYNLFHDDEYINISATGTPDKKYDNILLNELNNATPSKFKCSII